MFLYRVFQQNFAWILNIVYSFGGRKFEHALKHGPRNGLFIVTLGWFVDSVRRNGEYWYMLWFQMFLC